MLKKVFTFVLLTLLAGCLVDDDTDEKNQSQPVDTSKNKPLLEPTEYQTAYKEGFIPWPHHDPEFNQTQFENMYDELHVWSAFLTYQTFEEPDRQYTHGGLDISMPDGTKVFAVVDGTVVVESLWGGVNNSIVIADKDNPDWGWSYAHIDNIQVTEGDSVYKGNYLADSYFPQAPHIHFDRVHRTNGSWESFHNHDPQPFVHYDDNDPPQIGTELLIYSADGQELLNVNDSPIGGIVDFVVTLHDRSSISTNTEGTWPHQWLPTSLLMRIENEQNEVVWSRDYKQAELVIPENFQNLLSCGKRYFKDMRHGKDGFTYDIGYPYVRITRLLPSESFTTCTEGEGLDTTAVDDNGQPVFENGKYTLFLTAKDLHDNKTSRNFEFEVLN